MILNSGGFVLWLKDWYLKHMFLNIGSFYGSSAWMQLFHYNLEIIFSTATKKIFLLSDIRQYLCRSFIFDSDSYRTLTFLFKVMLTVSPLFFKVQTPLAVSFGDFSILFSLVSLNMWITVKQILLSCTEVLQ